MWFREREDEKKILNVQDKFLSKEAKEVFKKCRAKLLANELIDASVLKEKDNKIKHAITEIEAYPERIDLYIKELKQDYLKQKLQATADIGTAEEMLKEITEVRDEILGETQTVKKLNLKNVVEEYFRNIENPPKNPLRTGWKTFDDLVQMQMEDLVIIAGRPGMGKTAFILSQALTLAKNGNKGIFFSLEMSEKQIIDRIMSQMSGVPIKYLKTKEGFARLPEPAYGFLNTASAELSKLEKNLNFITGNFTVNKILEFSKIEQQQHGLDYIIVDYMQLLTPTVKGSRYEQVTDISISLKKLAKELGITVIALAQLSRDVEKRADRKPVQSDLRDSGQVEQDASIIIGLYREAYYNEGEGDPKAMKVIVLKNRNGELGTIPFEFLGAIQRVREL